MSFPASEIISRIKSSLDSEDTNHYDDTRDIIPAINSAIGWTLSLIEKSYGVSKFGEEALVDTQKMLVFKTNAYSRVFFSGIYGILGVFIDLITNGTASPAANDYDSPLQSQLHYISSNHSARRLTAQQVSELNKDPFLPGNSINKCDDLKEYGYVAPYDYNNLAEVAGKDAMIEIFPTVSKDDVGILCITEPALIANPSDPIPFNRKLFELVYTKTLEFMSYKMGEGVSVKEHTMNESNLLVSLFNR